MALKKTSQKYLESQVLTAPKEELLLMLFDGGIRFAEQAKSKLEVKDYAEACRLLIRVQRIIMELISSLKRELLDQELYDRLVGLYLFVYLRMVNANIKHDVMLIDEGLTVFRNLRETWVLAIDKNRKEKSASLVPPDAPKRSSLSIQG